MLAKDRVGKPFDRDEKYVSYLFKHALDRKHIHPDAEVRIKRDWNKNKLRARCELVDCWLQFPTALRIDGARYICDIVEVPATENKSVFYRAVKGSIRSAGSDIVRA